MKDGRDRVEFRFTRNQHESSANYLPDFVGICLDMVVANQITTEIYREMEYESASEKCLTDYGGYD
jgi:hypothetical protein